MFVIFLRLTESRHLVGAHLAGHNNWIRQGVDDGAFLLVGSLSGGQGGAIIAHGLGRADLEKRLGSRPVRGPADRGSRDIEIQPAMTDHRLAFTMP